MTIDETLIHLKDILVEATETEDAVCYVTSEDAEALEVAIEALENQRESVQVSVIQCKDCKWWDEINSCVGYCMAMKHNYYSRKWQINIQRTYTPDFYCADAEPRKQDIKECE